jgi:Cupin-like domain
VELLAAVAASNLRLEKQMASSRDELLFPPFSFTARPVPVATDGFDFDQWKRQPSAPIILKGTFTDWPLFQNLKTCRTDEARLDYLSSAFGENMVGYTKVPARDPFMGYDESGKQNFKYAPASCRLSEFCVMMKAALQDPESDVLYARGGANSVRTWSEFSQAIRPLNFLRGMSPNGEGIWLGTGSHISYLHQDAHFNFFAMVTGIKRVLLYPLEAIGDLYPTPFYGGIAGTTSSFVRPRAPDRQRFPRFTNAAKHAWLALIEEGDLLCLPPCWWHYVEAAPGLNLMINTFVWALPPRQEREFEAMMRKSIRTERLLSKQELANVRNQLCQRVSVAVSVQPRLSRSGRALLRRLSRFLRPDIPEYWQKVARCYYDHYIFQLNGHPVSTYPDQHINWIGQEATLKERCRKWLRFYRDLVQMMWRRKMARGIVP